MRSLVWQEFSAMAGDALEDCLSNTIDEAQKVKVEARSSYFFRTEDNKPLLATLEALLEHYYDSREFEG